VLYCGARYRTAADSVRVCRTVAEQQEEEADNEARRRLARHRPITLHHSSNPASPGGPVSPRIAGTSAGVDDVEMQNYQPGDHGAHEVGPVHLALLRGSFGVTN